MSIKNKQTEIGVIPEDWEIVPLKQLYTITSSKRVFQSEWKKTGIPFYRAREIAVMSEGKEAPEDLFITYEMYDAYTRQYGAIAENDILITGVGTLGKVYVVKASDRFYFKDGNIIWLQWKGKCCSQYIKYLYDMPYIKRQVFDNAGGSTVGTYTISNAQDTMVAIPNYDEQCKTAKALSDIDELISSLEKLIAKKKAIKQGAMQQLLTGKTRLPGYTAEWEEKRLGEYIDCIRGVSFDGTTDVFETETSYTIRLLRSNNIHEGCFVEDGFLYINAKKSSETQRIRSDDIMICMANGSKSLVGKNCLFKTIPFGKYTFGVFMSCLRKKSEKVNMSFIYYVINTNLYWKYISIILSGSSINNLRPGDILSMRFRFPSMEEQNAIAKALTNIDSEIWGLEEKKNKAQAIKQGMMQQLLFGKIRLM